MASIPQTFQNILFPTFLKNEGQILVDSLSLYKTRIIIQKRNLIKFIFILLF